MFIKNVNHTVSVRVVIYILDFECDIVQKTKDKNIIRKNVNSVPIVKNKLKDFFYEYSKVYILSYSHFLSGASQKLFC